MKVNKTIFVGLLLLFAILQFSLAIADSGSNEDIPVTNDKTIRIPADRIKLKSISGASLVQVQPQMAEPMAVRVAYEIGAVEQVNDLSAEDQEKLRFLPIAKQREILMGGGNIKTALMGYEIRPMEFGIKKRVVAENEIMDAKENFIMTSKEYIRLEKEGEKAKERFNKIKAKVNEACKDGDSVECLNANEEALEEAKIYASNMVSRVQTHIDKLIYKTEASENLDEEIATEIIFDLYRMRDDLSEVGNRIDSATSKDEFRLITADLKQLWSEVHTMARIHATRIINSDVWQLIAKAEDTEKRIERVLLEDFADGSNIGDLWDMLSDYSEKVAEGKGKYQEALRIVDAAESDNSAERIEEARSLIKEAHKELIDANKVLGRLINELKESDGIIIEHDLRENIYKERTSVEVVEIELNEHEEETKERKIDDGDDDRSIPLALGSRPAPDYSDEDAYLGDANAPVTIVEFSDFECPFCRNFATQTLPLIIDEYIADGKVRLVFRDLPLDIHSYAQAAAEAAECAGEEGKYFEMHDLLFKDGVEGDYGQYAERIGLDLGRFNNCVKNRDMQGEVFEDKEMAETLGLSATPSFFINGKLLVGAQPYAAFKQYIESALN